MQDTLETVAEGRSGMLKETREPTLILKTGAGYRTDIDIRHHHVIADEPVDIGGTDLGPRPVDYLAVALGGCTSITLRMYADRKGWPLEDVVIRIWRRRVEEKDENDPSARPRRVDLFESEIELGGDLTDEQRQRLLEIAGRCPVKRTLESGARMETRLAP